jgi:ABC-type sugar transport system permease subunit
MKNKMKNQIIPWLFLAPFLSVYLCFFLGPALYSFCLSFMKYKGYGAKSFVGLGNYTKLLNYPVFWSSLKNTLFYLIGHVILVVILSFLLAVLIKSKVIKQKSLFKVGFFVPQITASVAAIMIWKVVLGTRAGVINTLLGTQIPFLESLSLMKWSVILVMAWRSIGWYMVIFFAGLSTVSEEVVEAAEIDGATAFQRMIKIIIPLMKPTFVFVLFNCCVTTFKVYNEPNLLIGNANSAAPTSVAPIMNLVTNNIKNGNFGTAAAAGWLIFLFIMIISGLQAAILREDKED